MKEIPVYLFTGFLEGGKTKFIQETLCDDRFNTGERTLLLVCEEGEEEYDVSAFSGKNVFLHIVDGEENFTKEKLAGLAKKFKIERVVIEYNGMWMLDTLYANLPDGWSVWQEMMFASAESFIFYNTNMRSLVVDKLQSCEILILNRSTADVDREEIHKIVRGVSRRADIAYEFLDGHVEYDEIEDPLPFDVEADVIEIEDSDYALWYRDISEDMPKYVGKTVKFKGTVAAVDPKVPDTFVFGRPVMVCCEADIAMRALLCKGKGGHTPKMNDWCIVEAKITLENHEVYKGEGPILNVISLEKAAPPENEVATFY